MSETPTADAWRVSLERSVRTAVCGMLAALLPAWASAADRPNILMIVTDDQGAQMGALGTPGVSTPNMDAIAAGGTLFRNAFVPHPTCSASRAAIMTGTLPHTNGTLTNVNEFFGPDPSGESWYSNPNSPYNRNSINPALPTLIEKLDDAGYRTAVTSKLHLATHDRFPFDVWISGEINGNDVATGRSTTLERFLTGNGPQDDPFFAMVNIRSPHRPLNSFQSNSQPDPDPSVVEIPATLPDTPAVRDDWVRYLKAIQRSDDLVGEALTALSNSGRESDTLVVFLGDHGPAYHNGKWTPYDLGLRVPMAIRGPGFQQGAVTDELASSLDLMPTLLEAAGIESPAVQHGESLIGVLSGTGGVERGYVIGEVPHPSGHTERSVHDQRHHLIYRTNRDAARLVPADNRDAVWGNCVYQETIDQQNAFPAAYERLQQIDNGTLGGSPPEFELYDLQNDKWETTNLAADPQQAAVLNRMKVALQVDAVRTEDTATRIFATQPQRTGGTIRLDLADGFDGVGPLDADPAWTTQLLGASSADFEITGGVVDAPPGPRALATRDGAALGVGEDFAVSVETRFPSTGVGGGVVFGYTDNDNYHELQLLDGRSTPGGVGKDLRLRQRSGGVESQLLFTSDLPNYSGGWYEVNAAYDADTASLQIDILDDAGQPYYSETVVLTSPLPAGGQFGFSTWSSNASEFDNFSLRLGDNVTADGLPVLGDLNGDGRLSLLDAAAFESALGQDGAANAAFNFVTPDEMIDETDFHYWLTVLVPLVNGIGPADGDFDLNGVVDIADYMTLTQSFGGAGAALTADGNGDGRVDAADYTIWRDGFAAQQSLAIPEPTAICQLLAAITGLRLRRSR
ncbi:MAG: sulfatase-like hydrolase/transferase [Planctomycetota bacterium]